MKDNLNSDCCRHVFRVVSDEHIAEIASRIEEDKMREARLSAMSSVTSVADTMETVNDNPQPMAIAEPMAVDEPVAVTDQPMQCPGL